MEAKDTVMTSYLLRRLDAHERALALEQAEISFAAGISEVASLITKPIGKFRIVRKQFVEGEPNCVLITLIEWEEIQSKIKNLGKRWQK